jgi:plastocyanin
VKLFGLRRLGIVLALVGCLAVPASVASAYPRQAFRSMNSPSGPVPLPSNGALFGAYASATEEEGMNRQTRMEAFEDMVGRKAALERIYYVWDDPFPDAYDYWSRDQGRTLILSMAAGYRGGGDIPWAAIANGTHDAVIDARAEDIKAFGAPLFFAFHHEPGISDPSGTPADFVRAYQHIRDRFESKGVTNVSYTLILMAWTYQAGYADQFWPGDDYVDILGVDGFNWYGCTGRDDPWTSFEDVFADFYAYGKSKSKPMLVAEWGSGEDDAQAGRKADWITEAAETLKGWPEIKAVAWYDALDQGRECSSRIDTSPSALDAFVGMAADSYFDPVTPPPYNSPVGAYISVVDDQFGPAVGDPATGKQVDWLFLGPSEHSATDDSGMDYFDSGSHAAGTDFAFKFVAAGDYPYICSINPGRMGGTIKVPLTAEPPTGRIRTSFTVTWASVSAPNGYLYDVQIQRPGQTDWSEWMIDQTARSATFLPDAGRGMYSFRSRLRRVSNEEASWYSQPATIKVSGKRVHPDFNGDDVADVAIGVPGTTVGGAADAGAIRVLYGVADGGLQADLPDDQLWTRDSGATLGDPHNEDSLGSALAAGDFNGDEITDLAIGVPNDDSNGAEDAGKVNVIYGSDAGLSDSGNQLWSWSDMGGGLEPETPSGHFGASMASGDFNEDGFDDLAVGAPGQTADGIAGSGTVSVLYGSESGVTPAGHQQWHQNTATVRGKSEVGDQFGTALAAGDFDGDGADDLAVGAPGESIDSADEAGAVSVLYGAADGLQAVSPNDDMWHQNSAAVRGKVEVGDQFGSALAAGDFDGDGEDDLAVGTPGESIDSADEAGAVSVLYGAADGLQADSPNDDMWHQNKTKVKGEAEVGDQFGTALAAGDFDGDGEDDLAVGTPGESIDSTDEAGAVSVLYGAAGGLQADSPNDDMWHQNKADIPDDVGQGDRFGSALAAADFDADESLDLAIGVPGETAAGQAGAGAVSALYGSAGGLSASGSQHWSSGSPGISDPAEVGGSFGLALV